MRGSGRVNKAVQIRLGRSREGGREGGTEGGREGRTCLAKPRVYKWKADSDDEVTGPIDLEKKGREGGREGGRKEIHSIKRR